MCEAVAEANQGLIDARLCKGVIKKRVARTGQGKSGGFRTIILFKINDIAVFVYGFAKNERSNISESELKGFKKLVLSTLGLNDEELVQAVNSGALIEVICNEEAVQE